MLSTTPTLNPASLVPFSQGWVPPTRDEFRSVMVMAGFSPAGCAQYLGVSRKVVNTWTTGAAPVQFSCWSLLCLKAGLPKFWDEAV